MAAGTATTRTTHASAGRSAILLRRAGAGALERPGAGAVAANHHRPWSPTGLQERDLRRLVRVSYAKVAEFQRRGAIHFHSVIRLDGATDCRCPACFAPPPEGFTAAVLEDALRLAVPAVRAPCPPLEAGGPERYARWGEQLDVRNITAGDDQAGELSAEQVAGYIAKYATAMSQPGRQRRGGRVGLRRYRRGRRGGHASGRSRSRPPDGCAAADRRPGG